MNYFSHTVTGVFRRGDLGGRLIAGTLLLLFAACSPERYRQAADRQVATILAEKAVDVPGFDPDFSIQAIPFEELEGPINSSPVPDFLGEAGEIETGARVIGLAKALELATRHNRSYQNTKEGVYLDALGLTLARYRFTPVFSGSGQINREVVRQVTEEVDGVTETQHTVRVPGGGRLGVNQLVSSGARLAGSFTTDFLRFILGGGGTQRSSRLVADLSQPLLRGRGYRVTMEALTQAERNVLYSLRDFVRYRQEFSVRVASAYYRVLLNRELAKNAFEGLQNFRRNAEQERDLQKEGRRSLSQLGQLEQAELSAESQWINAVRNYRQSLDDYKVRQLGMSTSAPIVFDTAELEKLVISHPEMALAEAIEIALASRLDLHTVHDQAEDAKRRVEVQSNAFLPDLDVILSGRLSSPANEPFSFGLDESQWNAGLNVDLPFDRRSERNAYRSTLIQWERALRQAQLSNDEVQLEVTQTLRNLDQAKRQYEISEVGVKLGNRRVEEEELRTELDLGTARDLVEARTDLISALNQRTSTLVDHTIARLEFWSALGILQIEETGSWIEPDHEQG